MTDMQKVVHCVHVMLMEDLSGLTSVLLRLNVASAASSWLVNLKSGLSGAILSALLHGTSFVGAALSRACSKSTLVLQGSESVVTLGSLLTKSLFLPCPCFDPRATSSDTAVAEDGPPAIQRTGM